MRVLSLVMTIFVIWFRLEFFQFAGFFGNFRRVYVARRLLHGFCDLVSFHGVPELGFRFVPGLAGGLL